MRFRSVNSYQIREESHQHFLLEDRNDPVTGDSFSEGDEVVFCSVCKSAFLKDSWAYMGNKHCDQRSTLPVFPKPKKLKLQKPIELPFVWVSSDQRSSAFFIDILVLILFCISLAAIVTISFKGQSISNPYLYFLLGFVLFTFRDSILINTSIGKAAQEIYFIDVTTNLPATVGQTLGRNLLYWVMNGIFALAFLIARALHNEFGEFSVFFIGLAVIITNFFYIKQNIEKNYSWFDKLLGIRLVKKR
ncbi:hypothetical protein V9L05_22615 (plasmid) [Bernardetia sp. Wsw4-3y2]|uniref:hypothetical protein n=1 Tax=Bernardetia sp. Wsw4-3y2 TaxID=3127471 RepID=UPI0030CDDA7A